MSDPPPYPDRGDDSRLGRERESAPGRARWVSALAIGFVIALVLLFVFLHLTGTFGPGAH